jgi:hypothetical protein
LRVAPSTVDQATMNAPAALLATAASNCDGSAVFCGREGGPLGRPVALKSRAWTIGPSALVRMSYAVRNLPVGAPATWGFFSEQVLQMLSRNDGPTGAGPAASPLPAPSRRIAAVDRVARRPENDRRRMTAVSIRIGE